MPATTYATLRDDYFFPGYHDGDNAIPMIDYREGTLVEILSEDRRTDSVNLRLNVRFPDGEEINLPATFFKTA